MRRNLFRRRWLFIYLAQSELSLALQRTIVHRHLSLVAIVAPRVLDRGLLAAVGLSTRAMKSDGQTMLCQHALTNHPNVVQPASSME